MVPDPDKLQAELTKTKEDMAKIQADLTVYKSFINVAAIKALKDEAESLKAQVQERVLMMGNLTRTIETLDARLRVFQQLGTNLASGQDLGVLLNSLVEMTMGIIKAGAGSLLLLNEETRLLEFKVAKGGKADEVMKIKIPLGKGIVGWVAEKGLPKMVPEVGSEVEANQEIAKEVDYQTESIICVPLKIQDRVIGVLELLNKIGRKRFSKDDLDMLTALAGQIAVIVEHARLHVDAQEKVKELSSLLGVCAIVNSSLDVHRILNNVMESATVMLNAEAASVGLIDEEHQQIYFEVATGSAGGQMKEIRISINEGVAGWVVREQQPLLVNDVSQDPRFSKKVDDKTQFVTRSILAVPIRLRGKMMGVLEAINKLGDGFTQGDSELLAALANQTAVTLDNAKAHHSLRNTFLTLVRSMAVAVEEQDAYMAGHVDRMAAMCVAIGKEMGLPKEEVDRLHMAALFHDVGKLGVPDAILRKTHQLTPEEYESMKRHPELGAQILKSVTQFHHVIPGVLHHQERWDGSGYPFGLKGDEISLDGRIIAVADTFDAITTDRSYRKGLPDGVALEEIKRYTGAQFDPQVVAAFFRAYETGAIPAKGMAQAVAS